MEPTNHSTPWSHMIYDDIPFIDDDDEFTTSVPRMDYSVRLSQSENSACFAGLPGYIENSAGFTGVPRCTENSACRTVSDTQWSGTLHVNDAEQLTKQTQHDQILDTQSLTNGHDHSQQTTDLDTHSLNKHKKGTMSKLKKFCSFRRFRLSTNKLKNSKSAGDIVNGNAKSRFYTCWDRNRDTSVDKYIYNERSQTVKTSSADNDFVVKDPKCDNHMDNSIVPNVCNASNIDNSDLSGTVGCGEVDIRIDTDIGDNVDIHCDDIDNRDSDIGDNVDIHCDDIDNRDSDICDNVDIHCDDIDSRDSDICDVIDIHYNNVDINLCDGNDNTVTAVTTHHYDNDSTLIFSEKSVSSLSDRENNNAKVLLNPGLSNLDWPYKQINYTATSSCKENIVDTYSVESANVVTCVLSQNSKSIQSMISQSDMLLKKEENDNIALDMYDNNQTVGDTTLPDINGRDTIATDDATVQKRLSSAPENMFLQIKSHDIQSDKLSEESVSYVNKSSDNKMLDVVSTGEHMTENYEIVDIDSVSPDSTVYVYSDNVQAACGHSASRHSRYDSIDSQDSEYDLREIQTVQGLTDSTNVQSSIFNTHCHESNNEHKGMVTTQKVEDCMSDLTDRCNRDNSEAIAVDPGMIFHSGLFGVESPSRTHITSTFCHFHNSLYPCLSAQHDRHGDDTENGDDFIETDMPTLPDSSCTGSCSSHSSNNGDALLADMHRDFGIDCDHERNIPVYDSDCHCHVHNGVTTAVAHFCERSHTLKPTSPSGNYHQVLVTDDAFIDQHNSSADASPNHHPFNEMDGNAMPVMKELSSIQHDNHIRDNSGINMRNVGQSPGTVGNIMPPMNASHQHLTDTEDSDDGYLDDFSGSINKFNNHDFHHNNNHSIHDNNEFNDDNSDELNDYKLNLDEYVNREFTSPPKPMTQPLSPSRNCFTSPHVNCCKMPLNQSSHDCTHNISNLGTPTILANNQFYHEEFNEEYNFPTTSSDPPPQFHFNDNTDFSDDETIDCPPLNHSCYGAVGGVPYTLPTPAAVPPRSHSWSSSIPAQTSTDSDFSALVFSDSPLISPDSDRSTIQPPDQNVPLATPTVENIHSPDNFLPMDNFSTDYGHVLPEYLDVGVENDNGHHCEFSADPDSSSHHCPFGDINLRDYAISGGVKNALQRDTEYNSDNESISSHTNDERDTHAVNDNRYGDLVAVGTSSDRYLSHQSTECKGTDLEDEEIGGALEHISEPDTEIESNCVSSSSKPDNTEGHEDTTTTNDLSQPTNSTPEWCMNVVHMVNFKPNVMTPAPGYCYCMSSSGYEPCCSCNNNDCTSNMYSHWLNEHTDVSKMMNIGPGALNDFFKENSSERWEMAIEDRDARLHDDTLDPDNPGVAMLWSDYDARRVHTKQISASACGPTAVINVLTALGHPLPKERVCEGISVNLRREIAPVAQYLFSRSVAGTTADELMRGVGQLTNGEIIGKFFPFYPPPDIDVLAWLAAWIKQGAVPLATLNLQKAVPNGEMIPDAWHHQMIYGVDINKGVYGTNPLAIIPARVFTAQLCSESVLLVRRQDVVSRYDLHSDLSKLISPSRPDWCRANVLGQVVNVLREESWPRLHGYRMQVTSHVEIPAAYRAGVTLFVRQDDPVHEQLIAAHHAFIHP